MNFISAQELKAKIDSNEDFQLIDIRESYEFEDFNLGGINIPFDQVFSSLDKICKDKPVIFYCTEGKKSAAIIHTIKRKLNLNNISTLKGGIMNYLEEI